jgi:hypothetical protein
VITKVSLTEKPYINMFIFSMVSELWVFEMQLDLKEFGSEEKITGKRIK